MAKNLRIKMLLIAQNTSQRWLSQQTRIDEPTISRILNGRVSATEREKRLISGVLQRPVSELFNESSAVEYITASDVW